MVFSIVVACTSEGGIGQNGSIPWYNLDDLRYFQNLTTGTIDTAKHNAIIMGRKTWESLPKKPLQNRLNVVLSRGYVQKCDGMKTATSLDEALELVAKISDIENVFVIGGGELYREAIIHRDCLHVYVTMLNINIPCDTMFPLQELHDRFELIDQGEQKLSKYKGWVFSFSFQKFARKPQSDV